MDLLTYLLVYPAAAAVIGWVATEIMQHRSSLLSNIAIAAVGALLAGYLLTPILRVGTINYAITFPTILATLFGSIMLLAIVILFLGRGFREAQGIH